VSRSRVSISKSWRSVISCGHLMWSSHVVISCGHLMRSSHAVISCGHLLADASKFGFHLFHLGPQQSASVLDDKDAVIVQVIDAVIVQVIDAVMGMLQGGLWHHAHSIADATPMGCAIHRPRPAQVGSCPCAAVDHPGGKPLGMAVETAATRARNLPSQVRSPSPRRRAL